jgi:hypothetical protein
MLQCSISASSNKITQPRLSQEHPFAPKVVPQAAPTISGWTERAFDETFRQ